MHLRQGLAHVDWCSRLRSMNEITAYFDGLCEPRNPGGYACGGWHVEPSPLLGPSAAGITGHRFYTSGRQATNNVAEYRAALDALQAVYETGYRGPVLLRGDSQLVIRQVTGEWGCKAQNLKPLLEQLKVAMTLFEQVRAEWVPRDLNAIADAESRRAYQEARSG